MRCTKSSTYELLWSVGMILKVAVGCSTIVSIASLAIVYHPLKGILVQQHSMVLCTLIKLVSSAIA